MVLFSSNDSIVKIIDPELVYNKTWYTVRTVRDVSKSLFESTNGQKK